ncbi:DNA/RNA non-specific endonuclease [Peribacillus frigoritolerans]|uniref:DNA/RNA non-specific endonuclease n=1 Tax=Peribacillus frigoritolerans TaxID=450367 RepID=UPI003306495A
MKGATKAKELATIPNLLPYNPKNQLSLAGGVPYNVVNGTGLKEQLISMARVESELNNKGTGNANRVEIPYGTQIRKIGNKKVLQPNVKYKTKEGYNYETNEFSRIDSVEAELKLGTGKRNQYAQSNVGESDRIRGDYPERDDGGHLIASQFKGSGDIDNLVPMNSQINEAGGKWHQLEQEWASALDRKESVKVKLKPQYIGNSARPDSIMVEYSIDAGRAKKVTIQNQIGG